MNASISQLRRLRCPPREVIAILFDQIQQVGPAASCLGGSIGFKVHGQTGGSWIIELGPDGASLHEGEADSALAACTTRIYAFASELAALVMAPDAIPGLLETGLIAVEGDTKKLSRLSELVRRGSVSHIALRAGDSGDEK